MRAFILAVGVGLGCFWIGVGNVVQVIGRCLVIRVILQLGFSRHIFSSLVLLGDAVGMQDL